MRKVVCFLLALGIVTSFGMSANALDQTHGYKDDNSFMDYLENDKTKTNQNENLDSKDKNDVNQKENVEDNQNKNFDVEDNNEQNQNEINKNDIIENADVNNESVEILDPKLTYSTHVQDIGWTEYVNDGIVSGTVGECKQLEALKIKLDCGTYKGDILYSTHVENIGWTDFVSNDNVSGTVGKAMQLEAVKIKLTGDISNSYDIYYRVHSEEVGWLDWTLNGQAAGTQGYDYRLEAIEIRLIKKGEDIPVNLEKPFLIPGNIYYSTHVQDIGWMNKVGDGETGGTTNQNKQLEAVKIFLNDALFEGQIEYSTHVQDIGWTNYVSNGFLSGTVGQNKQIESIKIRLKGKVCEEYDVYYRAHIENFGWLDWAKNDEMAGSEGFAYQMEAIEIELVKKGESAPGNTLRPNLTLGNVKYQVHVQDIGWINEVSNGFTCGTIGQAKKIEAMRVTLGDNRFSGDIEYSGHIEDIGWMDYVSNGEVSGTEGQSKRLEAVKVRLSGKIANYYDVYYRVHVQDFGWLGWTCNDRVAGTTNGSFRLEAIQIKLYPKNTGPGVDKKSVINFVADGNYKVCQDAFGNIYTDAEPLLGKRSGYTVFTNLSTNIVNVFIADGTGKEIVTYKRYQCTSGAPSTPTIRGTYYIYMKRYYFDSGASRCFYFSPFKGGYGFHTVLCYKDPTPSRIMDGRLGMYLSHGCIRLAIENAKWIYDNCPVGTKVINL